jgi:hypothetical protein
MIFYNSPLNAFFRTDGSIASNSFDVSSSDSFVLHVLALSLPKG